MSSNFDLTNIETRKLDHLGLVSATCDSINLVGIIDSIVGTHPLQKITVGEVVKAMILNALGFLYRPLYMYPQYLRDKAVDVLFRRPVEPDQFNQYTLGRALDKLYEAGLDIIFMTVAIAVFKQFSITHKFLRIDTTTFSVYGSYNGYSEELQEEPTPIKITYGHPKNNRTDLKQFVLSLVMSGNIPLLAQALSGNIADVKYFLEVTKKLVEQLSEGIKDTQYFVYDSAVYSRKNITELSSLIKWITRVPERIKRCRQLLQEANRDELEPTDIDGYRIKSVNVSLWGVKQRWLIVFSEKAYNRESETLLRNVEDEAKSSKKAVWHLSNKEFTSREAALSELKRTAESWKYHKIASYRVIERLKKTNGRGRPTKRGDDTRTVYMIQAEVERDEERISRELSRKGKVIIGTNELSRAPLSDIELLKAYKDQYKVERGFRFLKDKTFFANSVYLKSERRIEALMMVMGLALLVYGLTEWILRKRLVERNEYVADQKGRPTQKPTLKWIFFKFSGVAVVYKVSDGRCERLGIVNRTDEQHKVLRVLGSEYLSIYGW